LHWYLVDALAAGNHVMLKPSESTPRTSALLAEVLAEVFPIERVAVVQGGADVGAAFAASGGVNARNVARIAAGKFLNAGQTCIAPDDALVHEAERDAFVALLRTCVAHHYSRRNAGGDYASIVNGAQHAPVGVAGRSTRGGRAGHSPARGFA
jgi:coniferyl-aldehyde dehydrogenase